MQQVRGENFSVPNRHHVSRRSEYKQGYHHRTQNRKPKTENRKPKETRLHTQLRTFPPGWRNSFVSSSTSILSPFLRLSFSSLKVPMAPSQAAQSLFGHVVQPDSLSLFSSTSSDALALWTSHQDADLLEDSGIRLLNDATNEIAPYDSGTTDQSFVLRSEVTCKGNSSEPVLHIQSPAIRKTFIQSPPDDKDELGILVGQISFQFKTLGRSRPFAFEVGVKDDEGQLGAIRVSSFQTEPRLYLALTNKASASVEQGTKFGGRTVAVLHLPLSMAFGRDHDETSLTTWQVLTLPLNRLARHLSDTSLAKCTETMRTQNATLFGNFHSISYVKVHANMRLRRVWCSQRLPDHDLPEFQMFS